MRTISTNYAKEFSLTDTQAEKLKEIDARVKKEIAEAERKFKEEIRKIRNTAKQDVEKSLSPEQVKTLEKYSVGVSK